MKTSGLDSTDACRLGNYLESEILKDGDLSIVGFNRPVIEKTINKSIASIEVGANIPQAWFDIGKLNLFLKEPYASFTAFIRAFDLSHETSMPEAIYDSLRRLSHIGDQIPGFQWVENLFQLGLASRFRHAGAEKEIKEKAHSGKIPSDRPVVILAGGSSAQVEAKMQGYLTLLKEAFKGIDCTLISGGTTIGISRLAGDLKKLYPDEIYTIGYLPKAKKSKADSDGSRYDEIRITGGMEYSPLEPTQYWIDLLDSGVDPEDVRLLAIHGGRISKTECILALMLGARVGIMESGGGESALLLKDPEWCKSEKLIQLPEDPAILSAFLTSLPG